MPLFSEYHDPRELDDRLRDAHAVTAELLADVIGKCRRFPSAADRETRGSNN